MISSSQTRSGRQINRPQRLRNDEELSQTQPELTTRARTRATGARAITNIETSEIVAADAGEVVAADAGEAFAADAGEVFAADAGEVVAADAGEGVDEDGVAVGEGVRVADDRLKWGPYRGLEAIRAELEAAHAKITSWKNNFFQMPRNATGKEAINPTRHEGGGYFSPPLFFQS